MKNILTLVLTILPFLALAQDELAMQAAGVEIIEVKPTNSYITIIHNGVSYYYGDDAIKSYTFDGNLHVKLQDESNNTSFTYYLEPNDYYIEYVNLRHNVIARVTPESMPSLHHNITTDRIELHDVVIDSETGERLEIYLSIKHEVE